jgi:hypothetical protein
MKKLLMAAALCASIQSANADQQAADAYAELTCDTMGTKVMDQFVISDEHLADTNAARKNYAEFCKKLFLLFKDGTLTKDQFDTALGDAFKGYIKTFDDAFPRQRTSILPSGSESTWGPCKNPIRQNARFSKIRNEFARGECEHYTAKEIPQHAGSGPAPLALVCVPSPKSAPTFSGLASRFSNSIGGCSPAFAFSSASL